MLSITLLVATFVVGVSSSSKFHAADLIGTWKNQLDSTFNVSHVDEMTMELRGMYCSPSGTTGLYYPVIGYVNWSSTADSSKDSVTVVSFSVRWSEFGSVTAWSGVVRDDGTLIAQWLLVRPVTSYVWDHILTGQDTFIKI